MPSYSEHLLAQMVRCPLMTTSGEHEPIYGTALATLRWALLREFNKDPVFPRDIRERFGALYKDLYYPGYKGVTPPPDDATYWAGLRKAAHVARKIRNFVRRYQVLHPIQPYHLQMGIPHNEDLFLTGEYALVVQRRAKHNPMVLIPHRCASHYHQHQDVLTLARWFHAAQHHSPSPSLYHLPLLRDDGWIQAGLNSVLVETYLNGSLSVLRRLRYPVPGSHCAACIAKDCLRVFHA